MGHVKLANYALAYKKIKNAAFDGPGSQSTVLFFVAADVDAICAFRILTVKKSCSGNCRERIWTFHECWCVHDSSFYLSFIPNVDPVQV